MSEVIAGCIAFSGRYKPSFYDSTVMWATSSRWSHCFGIVGNALGDLSVLEADLEVVLASFKSQYVDKKADYYEVWQPLKATPEQIEAAGKSCYESLEEATYGFLQPLWFLARAMLAKVGIKLKNNWFGGIVCSGLLFDYIYAFGGEYRDMLAGMNSDNASPQDLYNLVKSRPDLFQLIYTRE